MSTILWKAVALTGVIGVGSVIAFQAHKSLQTKSGAGALAADTFAPLSADTESLDADPLDLDGSEAVVSSTTQPALTASSGSTQKAALHGAASTDLADRTAFASAPPDQIEPEAPGDNPFADRDYKRSPAPARLQPADADDDNPFASSAGGDESTANVSTTRTAAESPWSSEIDDSAAPGDVVTAANLVPAGATSEERPAAVALDDDEPISTSDEPAPLRTSIPGGGAPAANSASSGSAPALRRLSPETPSPLLLSTPDAGDAGSDDPFAEPAPAQVEPAAAPRLSAPQPGLFSASSNAARSSIPPSAARPLDVAVPAAADGQSTMSSIPQRTTSGADGSPSAEHRSPPRLNPPSQPSFPDVGLAPAAEEVGSPFSEEQPRLRTDSGASVVGTSAEGSGDAPGADATGDDATFPDFGRLPAASAESTSRSSIPAAAGERLPDLGTSLEPEPKPATSSDLIGAGTIDRDVPQGPSQPQLTISKKAPAQAVVGQDLEYAILVKNIGSSVAHNVVVEDQIPKGSECTGTAPKSEAENKRLIWRLGTLNPGAEQTLRVRVTPTSTGEIGSIATVSFSAEVAAKTVILEPKADIAVSGPKEILVEKSGQFRFVVTNNGSADLKEVVVRTLVPEGLNHEGGRDLEYEIGDLPRGQARDVNLTLDAIAAGEWNAQVLVTQRGRELARATADVRVIESRLSVARTGPVKRFVGRAAAFTTTVTNNSSQPLSRITVVETLPEGLEPAGKLSGQWDATRRTITWLIPQLATRQSIDLASSSVPKVSGALQGRITAVDAEGDSVELATALEAAGFSALAIDIDHDGTPISVGDQLSLKFTVKNRGSAPAEEVQAVFELPEEVKFINAQGPMSFERTGNVVVFEPVSRVAAQDELHYEVVFQATKPTPADGDRRISVSLHSTQLPADNPLIQQQQLVILGEDSADSKAVLQTSGLR